MSGMKFAMISQPMKNLSNEEILKVRSRASNKLRKLGYVVLDNFLSGETSPEDVNTPVYFLSKSIEIMSHCDAVFFCEGWESARGCRIEHKIAQDYGLEYIYER